MFADATQMAAAVLLWELGLGYLCWTLTRPIAAFAERFLFFLSLNISTAALVATFLSFAGFNSGAAYLAIACCLLVAAWLASRRIPPPPAIVFSPWALLLVPFVFVLICCFRPVSEVDSLYNLHFLLGWLDNRTTPYDFAFHYVPFWELSIFPILALSRSDIYFWVATLKATLLVGVALWLIAGEFGLSRRLRWVAVTSCTLFPFLWFPPAGVATLKNDGLHAAGEIMFGLALVRAAAGKWRRLDTFLLTFACIFLSVKFSGPVFLIGALATSAVVAPKALWSKRRALGFVLVCWLVTAGHYYVHNLIQFSNPFYPFQINAPGIHLPGLGDLSNTSILYSLHDPRLWRAFFLPAGGLSPAGLFFPILLPVILLGSLGLGLRGIANRFRGYEWITPTFAFALFQLLVWLLYFRSVYSASGQPGDLAFVLSDLNSIRYAQGALLAATIFLVSRTPVPQPALMVLLVAQGASFAYLLFRHADSVAGLGGLVPVLPKYLPAMILLRWRRSAAVALVGVLFAWTPVMVEAQRPKWLTDLQPVWQPFWKADARRIYVVIDGENSEQAVIHFPIAGQRIQHHIHWGSFRELPAIEPKPEFIVRLKRPDTALDASGMEQAAPEALKNYGKVLDTARATIWSAGLAELPSEERR